MKHKQIGHSNAKQSFSDEVSTRATETGLWSTGDYSSKQANLDLMSKSIVFYDSLSHKTDYQQFSLVHYTRTSSEGGRR